MRKIKFINGEYYHVFNRGVDKRDIVLNKEDLDRFFESMYEFNTLDPIGSIYAASFRHDEQLRNLVPKWGLKQERLLNFVCYCLNPNHYHFLLQQLVDRGIEKFMHKLGLGYTNYFNKKYNRSGSLFQGPFKATSIDSNEHLLHVSAYINLNNQVHQLGNKFFKSSWGEYLQGNNEGDFCNKEIILNQFTNTSDYQTFVENSLKITKERKELEKILKLDAEI